MAITKCPECGHEVSTKAPACPQCGAPASRPFGCLKVVAAAGSVVVAALMYIGYQGSQQLDTAAGNESQAKTHAAVPNTATRPSMAVSAADLASAYTTSEIAADARFKGRKLKVFGVVDSVESDFADLPMVTLHVPGALLGVHATLVNKSDAIKLRAGESITMLCSGGGEVAGVPLLSDCRMTK